MRGQEVIILTAAGPSSLSLTTKQVALMVCTHKELQVWGSIKEKHVGVHQSELRKSSLQSHL